MLGCVYKMGPKTAPILMAALLYLIQFFSFAYLLTVQFIISLPSITGSTFLILFTLNPVAESTYALVEYSDTFSQSLRNLLIYHMSATSADGRDPHNH
jgi:hypothetical protein